MFIFALSKLRLPNVNSTYNKMLFYLDRRADWEAA